MMLLWFIIGCGRPSSSYDVKVYGQGTSLDEIHSAPQTMGGVIEYARFRIWGSYIGHGFTGLYGDTPYVPGTSFTLGSGVFAYPPHPSFDRVSPLITTGPAEMDSCFRALGTRGEPFSVEYVDVGDRITLTNEEVSVRLNRDPSLYPKPAGETWYIGYGAALQPALTSYPHGADTWPAQAADLTLHFPGTLPPKDTMVGAIPYPVTDSLPIPHPLTNVQINGSSLSQSATSFTGPWSESLNLTWDPAPNASPLTVSIRLIGSGDAQGPCDCDADCSEGLVCQDTVCMPQHGASDQQLGELVCTLRDDGEFSIAPSMMAPLRGEVEAAGALLIVSRVAESQISDPPSILTHNGKKLQNAPIRTRGIDAIITRLELSP
ncbi:MAG: hypothetical protein VX278_19630 [Myxococcota bacterium]|nr:hypothetical protein [Myxococcota bacterium]